jgi:hypothetical protein
MSSSTACRTSNGRPLLVTDISTKLIENSV